MDVRSMRFSADVRVLASVRDFAARSADELGSLVDRNDLAVVVGELAANATVHQHGDSELVLTARADGGLEVELIDPDASMPAQHHSVPWDAEGHRGLLLVEVLSEAWGVEPLPQGKRVWATMGPARDRRYTNG